MTSTVSMHTPKADGDIVAADTASVRPTDDVSVVESNKTITVPTNVENGDSDAFTWVNPAIWPDGKVPSVLKDKTEADELINMKVPDLRAKAANNDELSDLFTKRAMSFNRDAMVQKRRCTECLFRRKLCICKELNKLAKNVDTSEMNTELWILMRVDEFGSTSNTGRLAPMVLPNNAKLYIFGIKEHEKAILDHIKTAENPVVLYPSENALPVAEYIATQQKINNTETHTSSTDIQAKRPKVTLIVLEGTWSKVKPMQRFIPKEVPRVVLAADSINEKRSVRRESREGGCATLEAILAALTELHEPKTVLDTLNDAFDLMLEGALNQGNLIGYQGEFTGVHHQHMKHFHEELHKRKKLKKSVD
eukprot:CFRG2676T1